MTHWREDRGAGSRVGRRGGHSDSPCPTRCDGAPHHVFPAMLAVLVALVLAGCANTQTAATGSTTQAPAESQAEGSGEGKKPTKNRKN
jgi:hypothetical protein